MVLSRGGLRARGRLNREGKKGERGVSAAMSCPVGRTQRVRSQRDDWCGAHLILHSPTTHPPHPLQAARSAARPTARSRRGGSGTRAPWWTCWPSRWVHTHGSRGAGVPGKAAAAAAGEWCARPPASTAPSHPPALPTACVRAPPDHSPPPRLQPPREAPLEAKEAYDPWESVVVEWDRGERLLSLGLCLVVPGRGGIGEGVMAARVRACACVRVMGEGGNQPDGRTRALGLVTWNWNWTGTHGTHTCNAGTPSACSCLRCAAGAGDGACESLGDRG